MVYLVTGCAGFIGGNFTAALRRLFPRETIVGIDDFSTGRREALPCHSREGGNPIIFYEGSITDGALLNQIFQTHHPDYIFHFAALPRVSFSVEQPALTAKVNIFGTALLLEKARDYQIKRFIFSSSSSVYGGADKLPTSEADNPPRPVSPYALQKYVGELLCQNTSRIYGLDTVCLRYFNVFGPGQYGDSPYSTVISAWLESVIASPAARGAAIPVTDEEIASSPAAPRNDAVPVIASPAERDEVISHPYLEGDGLQSRDFCYVDNVVQANLLAMKSDKKFNGEVFNIGGGERVDLLTVKALIEKLTGKELNLDRRPPRPGDVRHSQADISKARQWFGYQPAINFTDGLKQTIAWFDERKRRH